jgi:hypothetical protein
LGDCSSAFNDLSNIVSALEASLGPNHKTITRAFIQIRSALSECTLPVGPPEPGYRFWMDFATQYLDSDSHDTYLSADQVARINIRLGRWWKAEQFSHQQHSCSNITEISASSLKAKIDQATVVLEDGSYTEIEEFVESILHADLNWPCARWDLVESIVLSIDKLCERLHEAGRSSVVAYYGEVSRLLQISFAGFGSYFPLTLYQHLLEVIAVENYRTENTSESILDEFLNSIISTPSEEAEWKWRMGNSESFRHTLVNGMVWDAIYWQYFTSEEPQIYFPKWTWHEISADLFWELDLPTDSESPGTKAIESMDYLLTPPGPAQLQWLSEIIHAQSLSVISCFYLGPLAANALNFQLEFAELFYRENASTGLEPRINFPEIIAFVHFSSGTPDEGDSMLKEAQLWEERYNFSCSSLAVLIELASHFYLLSNTVLINSLNAYLYDDMDPDLYDYNNGDDEDLNSLIDWLIRWLEDDQLEDLLFRRVAPSCEPYSSGLWGIYANYLEFGELEKAHRFLMRFEDTYFGIRQTCRLYSVLEENVCYAWTPRWEYLNIPPVYDSLTFPHLSPRP